MTTITLKPSWQGDLRRISFLFPDNNQQIDHTNNFEFTKQELKEQLSKNSKQSENREAPTHLLELRTVLKYLYKIDAIPDMLIKLSYKDDENDWIHIANDEDVSMAYQFAIQRKEPLKILIEKVDFQSLYPPQILPRTDNNNNNNNINSNNQAQNVNTNMQTYTINQKVVEMPLRKPELSDSALVSKASSITGPMKINTKFTVLFRLKNTGSIAWNKHTRLVWTGGDFIFTSCFPSVQVGEIFPGNEIDISVSCVCKKEGRSKSFFRLANGKTGIRWGDIISVEIFGIGSD